MNAQLREKHFENLRDPCAMEMYDGLCSDYERLYGAIPASAQTIICDNAVMEQSKRAYYENINKCGVMEEFRNGRQHFWRENKAVQAARALAEQQRKHMNELKLTPSSQRVTPDTADDEFNNF